MAIRGPFLRKSVSLCVNQSTRPSKRNNLAQSSVSVLVVQNISSFQNENEIFPSSKVFHLPHWKRCPGQLGIALKMKLLHTSMDCATLFWNQPRRREMAKSLLFCRLF